MSTTAKITPHLLVAAENGEIYDDPDLLMVCRRGGELALPRPDEMIPLPEESELFLMPGRRAVGFDPASGRVEVVEEFAVAAFVSPGHTLSSHAAFVADPGAPRLPMFAYGAVGFAEDRFWVAATRVDQDRRQVFTTIDPETIRSGAARLMKEFPKNRLVRHLAGCALTYGCPAARNLCLGRFEAPLPTSRACNAACVGCISLQPEDSGFPATQNRITFRPTAKEVSEIMLRHAGKARNAILSFGQGCEGEPLTEAATLEASIRLFREKGGKGTVNVNSNASLTAAIAPLAGAGLDSIRVSLNSARPEVYDIYYRPRGYAFGDVRATIREAKRSGVFVSLNLLFFPGITDTEPELDALADLVAGEKVDFIQLRNLNLDPDLYLELFRSKGLEIGPSMGLANFRKRLVKSAPWLRFGYFNPFLPKA